MTTRKPYDTASRTKNGTCQPYIPQATARRRPEKYPKREILNGIFYVARSGCAWRLLPHDLPPWESVYHYFWCWRQDGTWSSCTTGCAGMSG